MFIQAVFGAMDRSLENKSSKKLCLYFAHDLNIVHVLRTLNLVETIKPGFGAYVNFELYSNKRIKVNRLTFNINASIFSTQVDRNYIAQVLTVYEI